MLRVLCSIVVLLLIAVAQLSASDVVTKHVLSNGLTILVREKHNIPKAAVEICYNVGSKDELFREKGIAHLLEHMVLKGTKTLSEVDHGAIVRKLSGSCNGITSVDWTKYVYDLPSHNWRDILRVIADCMTNCTFEDDVLNSEMKAVIQELKMYNDNYGRCLRVELGKAIFADHPYHYPVIGYKQDLINVTGEDLHAFYKKHYVPNNATLVVVGDVKTDEVIALAQQHFGHIPADETYVKRENISSFDIVSKSVTLYRDVKNSSYIYAFAIPGLSQKKALEVNILKWIIGAGRGSRLYKRLVHDYDLATSVDADSWHDLFEHGLFFIHVDPKHEKDRAKIEEIIDAELTDLRLNGPTYSEFNRALKKSQMQFFKLVESFREQAYAIGSTYLATHDENYVFTQLQQSPEVLKEKVVALLKSHFRPSIMHKGYLLPLLENEKNNWLALQQESDRRDEDILSKRVRHSEVEPVRYAKTIDVSHATEPFIFPKAQTAMLPNGLKVIHHHNDTTPRVTIALKFKANAHYDPQDKQGLSKFVSAMMLEGTVNYTGQELIKALDDHGISVTTGPGMITMNLLESDLFVGLAILKEILCNSIFPEDRLECVRQRLLKHIKKNSDDPSCCKNILLKNIFYRGHPYSKQASGTADSIAAISREDIINFYKKYISPHDACLVIVGDLSHYKDIEKVVNIHLGNWIGASVEDLDYPPLCTVPAREINYTLNRDQAYLCLAQLSIDKFHPDFDKYRLFDYIFSGGNFHRGSRLFNLREQTGIFYAIYGSLVSGSDEQPGIFHISTKVSPDKLHETELMLKNLIDTVVDTITQEELTQAEHSMAHNIVNNFVSTDAMADTFLYLERFGLPADYFDNRAANLEKITLEEVKSAVKGMLNSKNMTTIRVGRV